jgi:hypothetical protein
MGKEKGMERARQNSPAYYLKRDYSWRKVGMEDSCVRNEKEMILNRSALLPLGRCL